MKREFGYAFEAGMLLKTKRREKDDVFLEVYMVENKWLK
jgi:hypothetical protein